MLPEPCPQPASMALDYVWLPSLVVGHLLALGVLLYGVQHGTTTLSWSAVLRVVPLRRASRPGRQIADPVGGKMFCRRVCGLSNPDVLQVKLATGLRWQSQNWRCSHSSTLSRADWAASRHQQARCLRHSHSTSACIWMTKSRPCLSSSPGVEWAASFLLARNAERSGPVCAAIMPTCMLL